MSLVLLCEGKTKCFKTDSKTKPRLKTFPTYSYFENVNYCRKNVHATIPIVQPEDILGDPGAISRVGRKGETKVFK